MAKFQKRIYLQTLKFEFHMTFICHEKFFSFRFFSNHSKNVKSCIIHSPHKNWQRGGCYPSSAACSPCSTACSGSYIFINRFIRKPLEFLYFVETDNKKYFLKYVTLRVMFLFLFCPTNSYRHSPISWGLILSLVITLKKCKLYIPTHGRFPEKLFFLVLSFFQWG